MNCDSVSDLRQYYDLCVISDKTFYICIFGKCIENFRKESDIISHIIKTHFNETTDESNADPIGAQLSPQSTPQSVDKNDDCLQYNTTNELNSNYNWIQTNAFKCHINGCGKTFVYMKSLIIHKNSHKVKVESNADKCESISGSQSKFSQLKQKYLKVQRLTDRSIHRWQKKSHRMDENYVGMQSLKNLDNYYRKDVINNEKYYFCEYNSKLFECKFKTKRSQHMARHLNLCHIRNRIFKCKIKGCTKQFLSPTTLRQHEINHICGFGILNGKTMTSVCSNKSINRFRERIIENGLKYFKCTYFDCPFVTKSHSCIKRHIHCQHLCPNRVITCVVDQNTTNKTIENSKPSQTLETNIKPQKFDIFEEIDRIIGCNAYNFDYNTNNNNNNRNNSDCDEIEIIDEPLVGIRVSDDFKRFIKRKKVKLDYNQQTYEKCSKELETLLKIRFNFHRIEKSSQYICNLCQFNAKTLQSISIHLRLKHFIE